MTESLTNNNIARSHNPRPAQVNSQGPDVITDPHKNKCDEYVCDLKGLHFHNKVQVPIEKVKTSKGNIFSRFLDFCKGIFGFSTKTQSDKPVAGTKVYVHEPLQASSIEKPPVYIYDGLVDLKFIKDNIDKYVFVFSGNAERQPGRFGQSAVLRPAREMYPESVVEVPVTQRPVTTFDPSLVPKVSLREDTDVDLAHNVQIIANSLDEAVTKSKQLGKTILLLKGGYGTGFARMYVFAPKTFNELNRLFEEKLGVRQVLDLITGQFSVDYADARVDQVSETTSVEKPVNAQSKAQTSSLWNTGWSMVEHGKEK